MINYELIRDLYESSGMSNKEFSDKVFGSDANRTIHYFKKRKCISTETLLKLCELFHVSADRLLGLPENETGKNNTIIGDNNSIDNRKYDNPMRYISLIKETIRSQEMTIKSLQEQIKAKDILIRELKTTLTDTIAMLKKSGGNRSKNR